MKNIRSKYFTIELYEESENINFNNKIDLVKRYEYAYILHNKDGVKNHYHCVVAFQNYRYLNAVSEEFEIPVNYIEPIRSLDNILMYLIHFNDKSKYQYNFDEVIGSKTLLEKLKKCIKNNGVEEEQKVLDLLDFVCRSSYITFVAFVKYACSIGRFDVVRRNQYLFVKIIEQHNQKILDDIY